MDLADGGNSSYGAPDMPEWMSLQLSTGTSIIAMAFSGGVVIGAESRTTIGNYIATRVSDKLTRVSDLIYCCRSGSAADTQALSEIVSYHLDLQTIELGKQPLVLTAANLFRELCYSYKNSLHAAVIVAGYDEINGGQVFSIQLDGTMEKHSYAVGGSGSVYVYGYVDAYFKEGMTQDACVELVKNSLALAMSRDNYSGGVIRMGIITKDGVDRRLFSGDDIPKFFEE